MNLNILSTLRWGVVLLATLVSLDAVSQSQCLKGYPERGEKFDVQPGFQQPRSCSILVCCRRQALQGL